MTERPILYSFRRCPYAMRARMALAIAEIDCEVREVVLRDKPDALLAASPKGTVPVLVTDEGAIEESLDIMLWALGQSDPEQWLAHGGEALALIGTIDGPFKQHLDRYKYPNRYEGADPLHHRAEGLAILKTLDARLNDCPQLCGDRRSLADIAIFPFVRQFAGTDRDWFAQQPLPRLQAWLDGHIGSELFDRIMVRREQWRPR